MSCTDGATVTPRPATPARVGDVAALLVMVTVSFAEPPAAGVNVTSKVVEPPGVRVAGKDGRLPTANPKPPPTAMLLTTRSAVPVLLMVKVCEALSPTRMLPKSWLVGLTSIAGAMPVPESRTDAPPASLLIETVSPTAPTPSGAKVTSKVTEPEGGMTAGSAGRLKAKPKEPPRLIELTVRSAVPVFEMVTVWAPEVEPTRTFPKAIEGGATLMAGATPVPESRTDAPPASLLIETVSPTAPTASGAKVTSKVAEPAGGMTAGSAGRVKAKPAAPPRLMLDTVRSAVPVFEMVTVCAPEVEPTRTFPKAIEGGATLMAGATPVPLKVTEAGPASLAIETVSPTAPTASGAKVTSKVAEPAGGITAWSAGRLKAKPAAPPRLMLDTVRSAVPVFEMVTV